MGNKGSSDKLAEIVPVLYCTDPHTPWGEEEENEEESFGPATARLTDFLTDSQSICTMCQGCVAGTGWRRVAAAATHTR